MATFELSGPDGGTYEVEAPDETSALDAFAAMNGGKMPEAAPQEGSSASGIAKSFGAGVGKSLVGLAGIPGDAFGAARRLLGDNLTQNPAFGSANIQKAVEGYTGEFYKPKGTLESGAETIGEFFPSMIGGPGTLGGKFATRVVAPALASEAAGQLAKGTDLEPYARVAGAVGGGMAASKFANNRSLKAATPEAPSINAIDDAKTNLYNTQAVKDLRIAPAAVEKVVDRAIDNAKSKYLDAPQTYRQLDLLKTPMNGPTFSIMDLENGRRRLNDLKALGGAEGEAARIAGNYLENIMPHWGKLPGAVVAGDAKAAANDLIAARANAAVSFRSELVNGFLEKAKNTASATHSGGNLENEIYKQVRTALNNPKKYLRGWNAEERAALKDVLPGLASTALRRFGKVLGGGGGLGQMAASGAGGAALGWPGAIAAPALGMAANKLGSSMATGRLKKVDDMLRSRAPLYGHPLANQQQAFINQPKAALLDQRSPLLNGLLSGLVVAR